MRISENDIAKASEKYEISANLLKHWYKLMGTEHLQAIYEVYVWHARQSHLWNIAKCLPKVYQEIVAKFYKSHASIRRREKGQKTKEKMIVEEIDARRETTPFHKEIAQAYRKLKAGKLSLENYLSLTNV